MANAALDALDALDGASAAADGGDAALDAAAAMEDRSLLAMRRRAEMARRVRTALRRRALADDNGDGDNDNDDDDLSPTFTMLATDTRYTAEDVNSLVFFRRGCISQSQEKLTTGFRREVQTHILATTLVRFTRHRQDAYDDLLNSGPCHNVASFRLKWDETEQILDTSHQGAAAVVAAEARAGRPAMQLRRTAQTCHVMVMAVWILLRGLSSPTLCYPSPRRIQRTTAETLWRAWSEVGFGPWGRLPSQDRVKWLLILCTADEASSNRRMYAQAMNAARKIREQVILIFIGCLMHVLHRLVVPCLKQDVGCNHFLPVIVRWNDS